MEFLKSTIAFFYTSVLMVIEMSAAKLTASIPCKGNQVIYGVIMKHVEEKSAFIAIAQSLLKCQKLFDINTFLPSKAR